jgi:phenylalanyl-tRNA synthetase beta chain
VWLDGRCIGVIGELHPRWRQRYELPHAPVLFELDLEAVCERDVPIYEALPRFQPVYRDLAFMVGASASHDKLIAALIDDPHRLVRKATLFDVYRGAGATPGEHSMAVRLELLDDDASLTDERIAAALQAARERAEQRVGARLRS